MKLKMSNIIGIIYSIFIVPIWGMTLLNINTITNNTIFLGFLFTIFSTFFILKFLSKREGFKSILIFIGPLFYLIVVFVLVPLNSKILLHPILWIFTVFSLIFFFYKSRYQYHTILFVTILSCIYSYILTEPIKSYSQSLTEVVEARTLNDTINLTSFKFLDLNLDTIRLLDDKVLIETWNERCGPCIASINDLESLIDTFENVKHIYLYENARGYDVNKIKSFKHITNKNKILIDYDNSFFTSSKMDSYPYFILFNKEGRVLDYFQGYKSSEKDYFINRLNKMLSN